MKELRCYTDNRIAVRFEYEYRDAETGQWMRCHGNELWEFAEDGLMRRRDMSGNDYPIKESDRSIAEIMDVFHQGERIVQSRVGVQKTADSVGRMIQSFIHVRYEYF